MTTERQAWTSLHPESRPEARCFDTCACGQDLDTCAGRHCPRCGTSLGTRAA